MQSLDREVSNASLNFKQPIQMPAGLLSVFCWIFLLDCSTLLTEGMWPRVELLIAKESYLDCSFSKIWTPWVPNSEVVNNQALSTANRQTNSTTPYLGSYDCLTVIKKGYNDFTSFQNCLHRRLSRGGGGGGSGSFSVNSHHLSKTV